MKFSAKQRIIIALSTGYLFGVACAPFFPSVNEAYAAAQKTLQEIQRENVSQALDIPEKDVTKTSAYQEISEQIPAGRKITDVNDFQTPIDIEKIEKPPVLKLQPAQAIQPPDDETEVEDTYKTRKIDLVDSSSDIHPANYMAPTAKYVMNPGPSPQSDIQDGQEATNAQGDAQMVFAYGENQLYKIYCKVGYITDLKFKKDEKITWVGGGDTAKWSIDKADGADGQHLYIKPISKHSTTNLIINTNKHTYNILCEASDFYNPMVKWNYGAEEQNLSLTSKSRIDVDKTDDNDFDFNYQIKGDASWKPEAVFDDGTKTYVKFKDLKDDLPVLMIKEKGKKSLQMVNYKLKNNTFIIDATFDQAQLMVNKDVVKIIKG